MQKKKELNELELSLYKELVKCGVNDFSISLDACCAKFGDIMSGNIGAWTTVVKNIEEVSKLTYVTVGIVLTDTNIGQAKEIIEFADKLGVADIRVITAAQNSNLKLMVETLDQNIVNKHPILSYRIKNVEKGVPIRGLNENDCRKCHIMMDDLAVVGEYQFPCIIYMREQGDPIGKINKKWRQDRIKWIEKHDVTNDPICSKNCLDCIVLANNKIDQYKKEKCNNVKCAEGILV
jgi:MoaA/NifB/PqqE/SkfB family radical SAM enzyme